ncbi:MAG TPA: DinB family protein, partial [Bacteroidota bacterium]
GAFVKQSNYVENQFVTLAEAIPQDKYNWRPAEGVRSIAESFLHVARGNYGILTFIGAKVPEGVDMEKLEKSSTDKATIVDAMKKSFKAVNDYVQSVPESDFGREIDFFGNKMTVLDMIMLAATHQHETLGQSIAYARSNGVKPPWSGM